MNDVAKQAGFHDIELRIDDPVAVTARHSGRDRSRAAT